MTRDDVIRMAREAGISPSSPYLGIRPADLAAIERFAALVADQYRLEGWQAAREMAYAACEKRAESWAEENLDRAIGADLCCFYISAMQPPADWTDIGNTITEQKQQVADVTLINEDSKWPHDDGFGGGLTEKQE